jgi:16S rRNA G527 N7-methylase RsmG
MKKETRLREVQALLRDVEMVWKEAARLSNEPVDYDVMPPRAVAELEELTHTLAEAHERAAKLYGATPSQWLIDARAGEAKSESAAVDERVTAS